jgi:CDP-2,3-bis-(O-geranylgeranyl)-sn-glycerol synthase
VASASHDLGLVASLFSPLFLGLVAHGLCIKFGWLRFAARPIDHGIQLRGRPLFGANKTCRGVLAVALGSALGYALQGLTPALQPQVWHGLPLAGLAALGFAIGAAAMLGELPNSFLKRQLGIAPGAPGGGPAAGFFYLYDQVDFLVGAWLVVWAWVPPTPPLLLWSLLFVVAVHQVVSLAGARLGMRASAR